MPHNSSQDPYCETHMAVTKEHCERFGPCATEGAEKVRLELHGLQNKLTIALGRLEDLRNERDSAVSGRDDLKRAWQEALERNKFLEEQWKHRYSPRILRDWQREAWEVSEDHGFHANFENDTVRLFVALGNIHSEVSEAWHDARDPKNCTNVIRYVKDRFDDEGVALDDKPVGFPIELADIVIRVLDLAEQQGIDLEEAMHVKHRFNKNRPHLHGDKLV